MQMNELIEEQDYNLQNHFFVSSSANMVGVQRYQETPNSSAEVEIGKKE